MNVNREEVLKDVKKALTEDIGSGDVSAALLPKQSVAVAEIIAREPMFVCGQPWVELVFAEVNPALELEWFVEEGEWLSFPAILCQIKGPAASVLTAERCALNFLQTLSGTATQVHQYVLQLKDSKTKLLDTRKTIPGLRYGQKYAVSCAGGTNHRMGLYDAFLIKENHIKACGSITKAIQKARELNKHLFIEIEVENLEELEEALRAKPDRILLDNFSKAMLAEAVIQAKPYQCPLEASGGVDLTNIAEVAQTGVDFISVGAMTKSLKAIDLSLLIREIQ